MTTIYTDEYQDEVRQLLVGRSIVSVDPITNTLVLDNGKVLTFGGNEGCGGCTNGFYTIDYLNECPVNAIMAVDFTCDFNDTTPGTYDTTETLKVFVLAEDTRILMLEASGDEGNGYYGRGWWVEVTDNLLT